MEQRRGCSLVDAIAQLTGRLPNQIAPLLEKDMYEGDITKLSLRRARFCPSCLADGLWYRWWWVDLWSVWCESHEGILLDRCATCGKVSRLLALLEGRCHYCGCTWELMPALIVHLDERDRMRYHRYWQWRSHPQDQSWDVLGLICYFAQHLTSSVLWPRSVEIRANRYLSARDVYHPHSVKHRFQIFFQILEWLEDWPKRWMQWLETLIAPEGPTQVYRLDPWFSPERTEKNPPGLDEIFLSFFLQHPIFVDLLETPWMMARSDLEREYTQRYQDQVARWCHTSFDVATYYQSCGIIPTPLTPRRPWYLDTDTDQRAAQRATIPGRTLGEVADWLATPVSFITALLTIGKLTWLPDSDDLIARDSVEQFLRWWIREYQWKRDIQVPEDAITLAEATMLYVDRGIDPEEWVPFLDTSTSRPKQVSQIGQGLVSQQVILSHFETIHWNTIYIAEDIWGRKHGIPEMIMNRWRQDHLFPSAILSAEKSGDALNPPTYLNLGPPKYLDRKEAQGFLDMWYLGRSLPQECMATMWTIQRILKSGLICWGWESEDVEWQWWLVSRRWFDANQFDIRKQVWARVYLSEK
jgi:hypothetical protein